MLSSWRHRGLSLIAWTVNLAGNSAFEFQQRNFLGVHKILSKIVTASTTAYAAFWWPERVSNVESWIPGLWNLRICFSFIAAILHKLRACAIGIASTTLGSVSSHWAHEKKPGNKTKIRKRKRRKQKKKHNGLTLVYRNYSCFPSTVAYTFLREHGGRQFMRYTQTSLATIPPINNRCSKNQYKSSTLNSFCFNQLPEVRRGITWCSLASAALGNSKIGMNQWKLSTKSVILAFGIFFFHSENLLVEYPDTFPSLSSLS